MRIYEYGDSVFVTCVHEVYTFATDTWAETDPDATFPKMTIKDPSGVTKVDALGMTKKATGRFIYLYTLPATPEVGRWTGYVDVENGTYPDRQPFVFTVR